MSQESRWFKPAKAVLLTGAGFTHTFGGYLASEMWAVILSQPEIRKNEALRSLILEELNYETLYQRVLSGDSASLKDELTAAIRRAYLDLHDVIFRSETAGTVCQHFISRFVRRSETNIRAFFFTLNQDLWVERFYTHGDPLLKIPGLECRHWFNGQLRAVLTPEMRVLLPDETSVERIEKSFWDKSSERFAYIKLHGSYGWIGRDGQEVMVIGNTKTDVIRKEPLLRWYLSLFKEVLQQPERYLLVIGYGFRDQHINDVIADAINSRGLRMFVVSPELPTDFRSKLLREDGENCVSRGRELWQGLSGYFRASVGDLYRRGTADLPPKGEVLFRNLGLDA